MIEYCLFLATIGVLVGNMIYAVYKCNTHSTLGWFIAMVFYVVAYVVVIYTHK